MKKAPDKMKLYLTTVYLITATSLLLFWHFNIFDYKIAPLVDLLFFSILCIITESFTVPFSGVSFSTSFAIQVAAFILFGPVNALIIILTGFTCRCMKNGNKYIHIFNTPFYKTLFNLCNLTLPMLYGAYCYSLVGGTTGAKHIEQNLMPIFIFCFVFFIVNNLLITFLTSIITKKNVAYAFIGNLKLGTLNILAMAPFGAILAILYTGYYSYIGVILFIFPILLSRYTFSLYIKTKEQYVETVDTLMNAMEARDKYTEGHARRVAEIVVMIAKELKYNDWATEKLKMAALLHDVGKIGIEDSVLNKPGKLSDEEYATIKTHSEIGYNILKKVKSLEGMTKLVRHHHERYDGNGYPSGKNHEELSIEIFILQLADSIDAMETDRPYRKGMSKEYVITEILECKGTQFHPVVVDAYIKALHKKGIR